uniref:Death domain-containing protein n=1 Tax=Biomphalaria glabrata TaxID=6526 RepID=A0A2C9KYF8_BIOGL
MSRTLDLDVNCPIPISEDKTSASGTNAQELQHDEKSELCLQHDEKSELCLQQSIKYRITETQFTKTLQDETVDKLVDEFEFVNLAEKSRHQEDLRKQSKNALIKAIESEWHFRPYLWTQPLNLKRNVVPYHFLNNVPKEKLMRPLRERSACHLATCFGEFWESVFYHLQMTEQDVSIAKADNKYIYKAATMLLMKWAYKMASRGTLKALIDQLIIVSDYDLTQIDWERILHIIREDD